VQLAPDLTVRVAPAVTSPEPSPSGAGISAATMTGGAAWLGGLLVALLSLVRRH
jgi:hypothetical protein